MITSIVAVVVAVVTVLAFTAMNRSRSCPSCQARLPAFRKPTSLKQMLWGGWTCQACKSEVDRSGKLLAR